MRKTLKLLKTHKCLVDYEILDFKQGPNFYYMKAKAELIDQSQLFIREYISAESYLYSYHWQDKNERLLIRWDNSPHHKNIKTYPHHKHTPQLEESSEVSLEDILTIIKKHISKRKD